MNAPHETPPDAQPDWAWFLDVDGTLIDIAPTPESVTVSPELPGVLRRLADRFGGAVALVSGRPISDLDRLFAPLRLAAAGQHGLERRDADGHMTPAIRGAALDAIVAALNGFAAQDPGLRVEDKGGAVALHYRGAPQMEGAARALADELIARHGDGYVLQPGKMVLEFKPKGFDKGEALRLFMAAPPFAGRRPVFLGDDLTDEHGFEAANALGGLSVLVGESRPSAARWRLESTDALRAWLARQADSEGRGA